MGGCLESAMEGNCSFAGGSFPQSLEEKLIGLPGRLCRAYDLFAQQNELGREPEVEARPKAF